MGRVARPCNGRRRAATARSPQQKSPSCPRRLPAAPGVVQARVGPVVGGDRPSHRRRSHHREALAECGSPAQLPAAEGASRAGRQPGTPPPAGRLRTPGRPAAGGLKRKRGSIHGRAGSGLHSDEPGRTPDGRQRAHGRCLQKREKRPHMGGRATSPSGSRPFRPVSSSSVRASRP